MGVLAAPSVSSVSADMMASRCIAGERGGSVCVHEHLPRLWQSVRGPAPCPDRSAGVLAHHPHPESSGEHTTHEINVSLTMMTFGLFIFCVI